MKRTLTVCCAMLLVAGCSSSSKPSSTTPSTAKAGPPACQSLVGHQLPAAVTESGCQQDSTIRAVATYTCKNGSSLVAFPGDKTQVYYWAPADQAVRSASWDVGNTAATTC